MVGVSVRRSRLAAWVSAAAAAASITIGAQAAEALTIYALQPGNVLVRFDSATPGTVTTIGTVTGLGPNEVIRGIDFRPATGQLFAGAVADGSTSNSPFNTYVIDRFTAIATFVGTAAADTADIPTGYDFNPTVDRIRYVNTPNQENARFNPNTGARADNPANDTNISMGAELIAAAYDRNVHNTNIGGTPPNPLTTLFAINRATNSLARIGGIDGTPSPNTGAVTDIGSLAVMLDAAADGGFDIPSGSSTAFAALTVGATTALYTINLGTGAATLVGNIGNGSSEIYSIAALFTVDPGPVGDNDEGAPINSIPDPIPDGGVDDGDEGV